MATRGPNQMPPLVSRVSDTAGLGLLIDWIASLKE
jgi:hypothetical protein